MGRIMGERIALREFRQEDISGVRCWVTDAETTRCLGGTYMKPQTWEQSERYLSALLEGDAGGVNFAIADKGNLKYLGQCSLLMVDHIARHAELAIVLCPDCQGQGLGEEAIRLLLRYAFDQMNLQRVYLKVRADNPAAVRCYEKCGFQLEGTLRSHAYAEGEYHDVLLMGILRAEFSRPAGYLL